MSVKKGFRGSPNRLNRGHNSLLAKTILNIVENI